MQEGMLRACLQIAEKEFSSLVEKTTPFLNVFFQRARTDPKVVGYLVWVYTMYETAHQHTILYYELLVPRYSQPSGDSQSLIFRFVSMIGKYILTSFKIHSTVMRSADIEVLKAVW